MEFSVLGQLVVKQRGAVVPIKGQLRKALLGILLLNGGRVTQVSTLIDGMWPTAPPRSAVENIRTYIYQLRSVFQSYGEDDRIESYSSGYRIDVHAGELDLSRFMTLARSGRETLRLGRASAAVACLTGARALWSDKPLGGIEFGANVSAKLVAIEEHRRQVDADLIEAWMLLHDYGALIPMLRQLVVEYPLDEALWCRFVITLYALGRTAEALEAYADARRVLRTELGIEPGPELRRVQQAVLSGEDPETLVGLVQRQVPREPEPVRAEPHQTAPAALFAQAVPSHAAL